MNGNHTRKIGCTLAVLLLVGASAAAQEPLGSGFTYQGELKLGGSPVNDTADFEFTLWDAEVDGNMIGALWPVNNVNVVDGLFTALLDFGVDPYTTNEARWLEIAVRSPSGKGDFTTLDPRQRLTPTPFSLATRGINVDANGNVGIGTTGPSAHLDVRARADGDGGTIRAARRGGRQWIELRDNNHLGGFITGRSVIENKKPLRVQNVFGGSGEPSGSTDIVFQVGDEAAPTEAMRILENGNVGIAVNPTTTLDIGGELLIRDPVDFNVHSLAVGPPLPKIVDGTNNGGAIYLGAYDDDPTAAIEASWGGAQFPQLGIGVTRGGTRANILMDFEGRTRIRNGTADILVVEGSGNVGIGTPPAAKLHVGGVPGVDGIMFPDGTLQTTASQGGGGCPCPYDDPVRAFKTFVVEPGDTEQQTAFTAPADRPLYVTGVNVSHVPNSDFGFLRILIDAEVVLEFTLDASKPNNDSWSSGGGAPILVNPNQNVVVEVRSIGGVSMFVKATITGFQGSP